MIDTENVIDVKPISTKTVNELAKEVSETIPANIVIKNQADYSAADNALTATKMLHKRVEEERKKGTAPLDAVKKAWQNLFMPLLAKLAQTERTIKDAMLAYDDEQERIRRAEEARLQEKAEKERQAALKRAEEARAKGNEAKAEILEEKAASVVAPVLAPRVEQTAGTSFVIRYSAEVIDFALLPDEYKIVDQKKLDAMARALKDGFNVPGAIAKKEKDISKRV